MKKLALLFLLIPWVSVADRLTISNETDQNVSVAVYYVPIVGKVNRASAILTMQPGENKKLDRPARRLGSDRELLIKTDLNFPSTYTKSTFKQAGPSINVGSLQAKRFYIGIQNGQLRGYTQGQWERRDKTGFISKGLGKASTLLGAAKATVSASYKAVVPQKVSEQVRQKLLPKERAYWQTPHTGVPAKVRVSNAISPEERTALGKRLPKVRTAIEKQVGPIKKTPKIAIVASGGGYRAMIFTIGFLVGAQKIGLLDMATWMSGLSGSTWAINSWVINNAKKGAITPEQFQSQFFNMIKDKKLETGITTKDIDLMSKLFLTDMLFGKPFTLVNMYGSLLANRLFANFGDQKQILRLSDQRDLINTGNFPIPIYTAVSGEEGQSEFYWYAFTPWEVSMEPWSKNGVGISVPSWGYGRKYRNGVSTPETVNTPEQSLGFQIGTYGSAFAAEVREIYSNIKGKIKPEAVRNLVKKAIDTEIGDKRITWAAVPNFMRGIAQSPVRDKDALQLVDAGIDFNLPYPPVSGMRAERTPDIIIFVDASANIVRSWEFKKTGKYARKKGLKFPSINYAGVDKAAVSIYESTDPSVPTVIYVPRVNDAQQAKLLELSSLKKYKQLLAGFNVETCTKKEACNTFNFNYTADDLQKLSALAEFNVLAYKDQILNAIKKRSN